MNYMILNLNYTSHNNHHLLCPGSEVQAQLTSPKSEKQINT